uniref:Rab-like protein n=1 Tax=Trepomonas sp. PC1 TaxID=1076344 RepID=A0A146K6F0_9EUKA|eukprot:JAP91089.1 Rab-like protein [Trepomonas sp. PC1]
MSFTKGKVVLAGQSATGKTTLLGYILNEKFEPTAATTTTAFSQKEYAVDGKPVSLSIWDTAGQERFRAVQTVYFRLTHIGLILFDYTNPTTFEDLPFWVEKFHENSPKAQLYLIGNKTDLPHVVDDQAVLDFASKHKMKFFKTSSVTGEGVKEMLEDIGRQFNTEIEEETKVVKVSVFEEEQTNKGCC